VSVPILSIARSTVTACVKSLPEKDVILSNSKGAEFLLAVLIREKLTQAGVCALPIFVCDADASVRQAFESFAVCSSIDRNHFMKAVLKPVNLLAAQLKTEALANLGVTRGEVLKDFQAAIDAAPAGQTRKSKRTDEMIAPSQPMVGLSNPVELGTEHCEQYEKMWYSRSAEERVGIPLVEQMQFVDSNGKMMDLNQRFILQRLEQFNRAQNPGPPPDEAVTDAGSGSAASAAGASYDLDDGANDDLPSSSSASSKRERSRAPAPRATTTKQVQQRIYNSIRRNALQCAAVCVSKNDPSILRSLCGIWLDHYAGQHGRCVLLFPGGCKPSMAALDRDGPGMRFLTKLVDNYFGTGSDARLESIAVALALHSNACESAGAAVRHYVQKNITFRARWKDGVYKHFLDKACGDFSWRQYLAMRQGVTLTEAYGRFLATREARRASKAAASLSGLASRVKTAQRHRAAVTRSKLRKGGSAETYKRIGQPSSQTFEAALRFLHADARPTHDTEVPAAGSSIFKDDALTPSQFAELQQPEPSLTLQEGERYGWIDGRLRYIADYEGGQYVAKELCTSRGWIQVFWVAGSRADLADTPTLDPELDPRNKRTFITATHSGPSDESQDNCRIPLGEVLAEDELHPSFRLASKQATASIVHSLFC